MAVQPTIAIVDNFNRADENPISETGTWVSANGHPSCQVSQSMLQSTNFHSLACYVGTQTGVTDGVFPSTSNIAVGFTITKFDTDADYYWSYGALFRSSDTPGNFYQAQYYRHLIGRVAGVWRVTWSRYVQSTGTETIMKTTNISTINLNDEIMFGSLANGDNVLWVNGVEVDRMNDTTSGFFNNNGYVGIYVDWSNFPTNLYNGVDNARIGTFESISEYGSINTLQLGNGKLSNYSQK
jgi:hypothetical protein